MRVLHLIDPGSPGGGACTLQLLSEPLARINSIHQDVLLIGNAFHEDLARRCGVEPKGRLKPPRNEPVLAGFAGEGLKTLLHVYERAGGPYDIIHCWTPRSTLLAAMAAPDHRRMATFAVGPVNGLLLQILNETLQYRECPILTTSVSVKRDYMAMGVAEEHLDVLPPAVHPEAVESDTRDDLRERWGVGDGTFVIGLLAEPMNWCDARTAASILLLAAESGRDVRLLVHPRAGRRVDAQNWIARLGMDHRIILEDDLAEPWRIVQGLDAALLIGGDDHTMDMRRKGNVFSFLIGGGRSLRPMPGVMPALWAMAAGVPVVAEASFALQEIIQDSKYGLLFNQGDVNQAADLVVRLHDDKTIGGRIAAAAKARVHEKHHVSTYCVQLKQLYQRHYEGRPVRVIDDQGVDYIESRREYFGG